MKKIIENFMKDAPPKKYYLVLCLFVLFISCTEEVGAIYQNMNFFTYEYGLINPCVIVYHNQSVGMQRLYTMLKDNNMGVEWIPQNIFIDAAIIYIILTVTNIIYKKVK
jgi:hypothetical protein